MALFNLSEFMTTGILNKSKNPVFRIKSISTGQEYVLKKLQRRDFQDHLSDFAELTYILRCCHHPNIIKIMGFSMNYSNNEYNLCLLMEMHKTDLQKVINNNRKNKEEMPKKHLISIIKQLVEALEFIQSTAKIAHRDLKPANILLDSNDNPLITDFSEAYFSDSIKNNEYREDGIKGTPEYMSPELKIMFMGTQTESLKYNPWASDVYSLGVLLINLASSFGAEENDSLEEKLEIIQATYGKPLRVFLDILVIEDQNLRGDFKQLLKKKEFLKLIEEVDVNESPKKAEIEDGENVDRISIILEGENQDEMDDKNECFGRKIFKSFDVGTNSNENIEENKEYNMMENSVHCHHQESPLKRPTISISSEMKELKQMLKNVHKNGKSLEPFTQVFKKIVMSIKELELENRVLLKELKTSFIKKSSSMNKMSEDLSGKSDKGPEKRISSNGALVFNCEGGGNMRRSMNIIYNLETKK